MGHRSDPRQNEGPDLDQNCSVLQKFMGKSKITGILNEPICYMLRSAKTDQTIAISQLI